jgi:SAM-dependent methyltransferase
MSNYRSQIYDQYASKMQGAGTVFDVKAARKWGKAYRYYLRGWLPRDKNAKILECACGYGRFLQFLKDECYSAVAAVDISPEQVSVAAQVGFPVCCEDVLDHLAKLSNEIDLIVAMDLIEHLRKDEALLFLERCYAALKPGGRLILQTPNASSPWGMDSRYNDFTHEICFNPGLLSRLLALKGFTGIEAREPGPVPYGYSVLSSIRFVMWQPLRLGVAVWSTIETGGRGCTILTRNFLIGAWKPCMLSADKKANL